MTSDLIFWSVGPDGENVRRGGLGWFPVGEQLVGTVQRREQSLCVCVCVCVCMYACLCVYVWVHLYAYACGVCVRPCA